MIIIKGLKFIVIAIKSKKIDFGLTKIFYFDRKLSGYITFV